jgi:hypothetical protein
LAGSSACHRFAESRPRRDAEAAPAAVAGRAADGDLDITAVNIAILGRRRMFLTGLGLFTAMPSSSTGG